MFYPHKCLRRKKFDMFIFFFFYKSRLLYEICAYDSLEKHQHNKSWRNSNFCCFEHSFDLCEFIFFKKISIYSSENIYASAHVCLYLWIRIHRSCSQCCIPDAGCQWQVSLPTHLHHISKPTITFCQLAPCPFVSSCCMISPFLTTEALHCISGL